MKTHIDFLRLLEVDVVLKILMCLHDPADIIRASAVSQYWRKFVISNGLCKQLCLRVFPQITSIAYVAEATYNSEPASVDPHNNTFEREHKTYASLFWACTSFQLDSCLGYPASASSTNNYPEESIINTMNLTQKCLDRYWSSKGHDDPEVPQTLIYYLDGTICVITEIDITPFQALLEVGNPIYSARFVRFRMGHPKSQKDIGLNFIKAQECADDKFVWTYTSETFPMVQESRLQNFTLPEPILCVGGFLQVEFLGRVQRKLSDGKYYICIWILG
ncbi:F-box domain-containing protein [Artemisia annua]|uniref:F-box domain-containing protein n=1 Tax=Artemisia annua TaxID=35608 RepID=A0A2U1MV27_ARTAN|nr:F-box domain-containing protein [Artemisia annua]